MNQMKNSAKAFSKCPLSDQFTEYSSCPRIRGVLHKFFSKVEFEEDDFLVQYYENNTKEIKIRARN